MKIEGFFLILCFWSLFFFPLIFLVDGFFPVLFVFLFFTISYVLTHLWLSDVSTGDKFLWALILSFFNGFALPFFWFFYRKKFNTCWPRSGEDKTVASPIFIQNSLYCSVISVFLGPWNCLAGIVLFYSAKKNVKPVKAKVAITLNFSILIFWSSLFIHANLF